MGARRHPLRHARAPLAVDRVRRAPGSAFGRPLRGDVSGLVFRERHFRRAEEWRSVPIHDRRRSVGGDQRPACRTPARKGPSGGLIDAGRPEPIERERSRTKRSCATRGVMNFLFVHQNFPGQYLHLVRRLRDSGHAIVFVTQRRAREIPGIRTLEYAPLPPATTAESYLQDVEMGGMNGLAVWRLCEGLKREGFAPDLVIGHTGWGEVLFVKEVWPTVPLLGYFEFFYRTTGSDLDFDPEFPPAPDDPIRIRMRNTINLLTLDAADWGQTPTRWQRDLYPPSHRERISVIHEGIDTAQIRPDPAARLWLRSGVTLSPGDEVITYSARNLEPHGGFHGFMRALPRVMQQRPNARVVIVGGDDVSYGRRARQATTWREQMLAELGGPLGFSPIPFGGRVAFC